MRRALAYAKAVADHRRAGERVGLLVVSVHDWNSGKPFVPSPEVCRVLLPAYMAVEAADWSVCLALDVLVCGDADDAVFCSVVRAVLAAGAVSCWGEFSDGVHRLATVGTGKVVAVDGPVQLNEFGAALRLFRTAALALRIGGYRSRAFDAVRAAMFGPLLAELSDSLCEAGQ